MTGLGVAFRADANREIGSGHVMRCLSLAEALATSGARIHFVCRAGRANLVDLIRDRGFAAIELDPGSEAMPAASVERDAQRTLDALEGCGIDWVVVDHYGIDAAWEQVVRRTGPRILAIDDLANRPHDSDILLDQNLVADLATRYAQLVSPTCTQLLGPQFALLGADYAAMRQAMPDRTPVIRKLLAFFGGADPAGMTLRTIEAFIALDRADLSLTAVLGAQAQTSEAVASLATGRSNITILSSVPSLAPLLAEADLALGAGGGSSWERLCLKLPTILVTVAENQVPTATELHRRQLALWLGDAGQVTSATIAAAIATCVAGNAPRGGEAGFPAIDGLGAHRVAAAMAAMG